MANEITQNVARSLLPHRAPDGHKGTFGHLLILAGSRGFTGAVRLAAEAACRSGAGLVTAGVPQTLADAVAATLVEAMSLPLPATEAESFSSNAVGPALEAARSRSAVALGPGISRHEDTIRFVSEFVAQCSVPLVIDADGLNCICHSPVALAECKAPVVLTPHPGEMARLAGCSTSDVQADRQDVAAAIAKQYGCVVVLKGKGTVVAAPAGLCSVNTTGNAGLATGGTGDVLTGLVGGLLAQGMNSFDAACLGVYLHGLAGDIASREKTQRGMIARDVIDAVPAAWRELERES
jgi:ADP-dependent NAD(P)H-hydrate dehydratase / NAD(P)H-hydrate epimerase